MHALCARVVSVAMAVLIATATLGLGTAAAASADGVRARVPGVVDPFVVRAKSSYEQAFNPFGDEWGTKGPANPSIPVGLTPGCFKVEPKLSSGIAAEEARFLAQTNHPFLWEECADVYDASGPNAQGNVGYLPMKSNIAAIKAINPSVKYIGYLAMSRAETSTVTPGNNSGGTVGVAYIHQNREDWFVHVRNTDPTNPANRVRYIQPQHHLYDVTKPDFRQFMVGQIVQSLDYHGMDGFVLDACFDLPQYDPSTPPPDEVLANWGAGCLAMLSELRAALDSRGKFVFFTGYRHLGTEAQGGPANEAAANQFYEARVNVSHGFYWEDPFGPVGLSDASARASFQRAKLLRDYAVQRGKYFVIATNANVQGQSTFGTTSAGQQRYFAQYYLAAFLNFITGPLTLMHYYTPIAAGDAFFSDAFFREWDAQVGSPLGADNEVATAVYQREFQNARVVANMSSTAYTVNLSDGPFVTVDGQAVGASDVVPPKTGRIYLRFQEQVTCWPRPPVQLRTASVGGGTIQVDVTAGATAGSLRSVRIEGVSTAAVDIQGGPSGITGPYTHSVPVGTKTVRLVVRKLGGNASTIRLLVTDGCGEWRTFVGAGANVR